MYIVGYEDRYIYKTIGGNKYVSVDYDRHSDNAEKAKVKTYFEQTSSDIKEVYIDFKMKIYSLNEYQNIFQTAPFNEGIRLELAPPSTLGLVVQQKDTHVPFGVILANSCVLNEWYHITISIDKNRRVRISINDFPVIDSKDMPIGEIDYKISDIAIGSGFSKTRDFDGALADFSFEYRLLEKRKALSAGILIGKIILILEITFVTAVFIFRRRSVKAMLSGDTEFSREDKITFISSFILISSVLSVGHYFLLRYSGFHHSVYDFMLSPMDIFKDFTNLNYYVHGNNPYAFNIAPVCPFPFLFRLIHLFAVLPDTFSIALYMILFIAFLLLYCYKSIYLRNHARNMNNIIICSLLTYPFWFTLSRGNYEAILFIFVALFVHFYEKNKVGLSILFLAMSIAMKLYPAIFLILFMTDKKYKEVLYTTLLALLLTGVSYESFTGGFLVNLKLNLEALQKYNIEYVVGNGGLGYGNSLFGAFKILIAYFRPESFYILVINSLTEYALMSFLLTGLIAVYILFVEKEYWKRIALLVFCMNLFPYVSADYKMIHFLIPLFSYLNQTKAEGYDLIYLMVFALLLIPKSFYYFQFDSRAGVIPFVVSIAGLLNPAIMLMGILIIIVGGIKVWYNPHKIGKKLIEQGN